MTSQYLWATCAFMLGLHSFDSIAIGQTMIDRSRLPTSYFEMITLRSVRDELNVTDEQLTEASKRRRAAQIELIQRTRAASDEAGEDRDKRAILVQAMIDSIPSIEEESLRDIFPEEQLKRLRELRWQAEIRRIGSLAVISTMKRYGIELDSAQQGQLERIAEESRQERIRLLQKLQDDEERRVLEVLRSDQREWWEKLVGTRISAEKLAGP